MNNGSSMTHCNRCGFVVKVEDQFCSNCGNRLEISIAQQVSLASKVGQQETGLSVTGIARRTYKRFSDTYLSQRWFKYWLISHCLILLLSMAGMPFNSVSSYASGRTFWPFGGFTYQYGPPYFSTSFGGILYCYDYTEFIAYLAIGFVIAHFISHKRS